MIRVTLFALALLATPAMAQDGHDHHVAEADGLRAVHAWANATTASTALVYADLENTSGHAATLIGAEAEIAASAQLVGLENAAGELRYVPIPEMPLPAGSEIVLAPNGLAIQLSGLTAPLIEGETFEIAFEFGDTHLSATVDIHSATATRHSHAGHQH